MWDRYSTWYTGCESLKNPVCAVQCKRSLLQVAQRSRRSTVPNRKSFTLPERGKPFSYKHGVVISQTAMSRIVREDMRDMLKPLILGALAWFHVKAMLGQNPLLLSWTLYHFPCTFLHLEKNFGPQRFFCFLIWCKKYNQKKGSLFFEVQNFKKN